MRKVTGPRPTKPAVLTECENLDRSLRACDFAHWSRPRLRAKPLASLNLYGCAREDWPREKSPCIRQLRRPISWSVSLAGITSWSSTVMPPSAGCRLLMNDRMPLNSAGCSRLCGRRCPSDVRRRRGPRHVADPAESRRRAPTAASHCYWHVPSRPTRASLASTPMSARTVTWR